MIAREVCTAEFGWTHDLPTVSGWYSVLWDGGDDDRPQAVLITIHPMLSGAGRFYSWGYSECDDPDGFSDDSCERPFLLRYIGPLPTDYP